MSTPHVVLTMSSGQRISTQFVGGQFALRTTVTVKVHRFVWPLPITSQLTGVLPSVNGLPDEGLHQVQKLELQRLLAQMSHVTATALEQVDRTMFVGQRSSRQLVTVAACACSAVTINATRADSNSLPLANKVLC